MFVLRKCEHMGHLGQSWSNLHPHQQSLSEWPHLASNCEISEEGFPGLMHAKKKELSGAIVLPMWMDQIGQKRSASQETAIYYHDSCFWAQTAPGWSIWVLPSHPFDSLCSRIGVPQRWPSDYGHTESSHTLSR